MPGLGHLYLRRHAQGVLLFALFASALNGVLVGALWQGEEAALISVASKIALVVVWIGGMASALKLTVFTDRERLGRLRDERVREGLIHYLKGEHEAMLRALEAARACDVDGADTDVLFHLGVAEGRLGRGARARWYFKRCLAWDPAKKWRVEVEREMARMEAR